MTAHDIAIYKPCAVIDRAYKDSPKEFFRLGNTPGQEGRSKASTTAGETLPVLPFWVYDN